MYSEKVREYFLKPRNMGKIKNPDGIGRVGNIVCGDVMHLYIKVGKSKEGEEILKDVRWETFGCAAAIATSSMVSEVAESKTLKEAIELSNKGIVERLGGLPPIKIHCSVLAIDALHEAIYDYLKKNSKRIPKKLERRHAAIQREMGELNKRYRDFLAMEEQLLERNEGKKRYSTPS